MLVCQSLSEELVLPPNAEGGMVDYRMSLCLSFFYKFYLQVQSCLDPSKVSDREISGTKVCTDNNWKKLFNISV